MYLIPSSDSIIYLPGEWGCWTEWSECSVPCGKGVRTRSRTCLAVNNRQAEGTGCEGPSVTREPCEMPPCCKYKPYF